jgi:hypothetical protein
MAANWVEQSVESKVFGWDWLLVDLMVFLMVSMLE